MESTTTDLRTTNLQLIKSLKEGIAVVGQQKVLKRLGFTRQNLFGHLNKENAEHANLDVLKRIADAINAEKEVLRKRSLKIHNQLVN